MNFFFIYNLYIYFFFFLVRRSTFAVTGGGVEFGKNYTPAVGAVGGGISHYLDKIVKMLLEISRQH